MADVVHVLKVSGCGCDQVVQVLAVLTLHRWEKSPGGNFAHYKYAKFPARAIILSEVIGYNNGG